jgi:hypothetical protein
MGNRKDIADFEWFDTRRSTGKEFFLVSVNDAAINFTFYLSESYHLERNK